MGADHTRAALAVFALSDNGKTLFYGASFVVKAIDQSYWLITPAHACSRKHRPFADYDRWASQLYLYGPKTPRPSLDLPYAEYARHGVAIDLFHQRRQGSIPLARKIEIQEKDGIADVVAHRISAQLFEAGRELADAFVIDMSGAPPMPKPYGQVTGFGFPVERSGLNPFPVSAAYGTLHKYGGIVYDATFSGGDGFCGCPVFCADGQFIGMFFGQTNDGIARFISDLLIWTLVNDRIRYEPYSTPAPKAWPNNIYWSTGDGMERPPFSRVIGEGLAFRPGCDSI